MAQAAAREIRPLGFQVETREKRPPKKTNNKTFQQTKRRKIFNKPIVKTNNRFAYFIIEKIK